MHKCQTLLARLLRPSGRASKDLATEGASLHDSDAQVSTNRPPEAQAALLRTSSSASNTEEMDIDSASAPGLEADRLTPNLRGGTGQARNPAVRTLNKRHLPLKPDYRSSAFQFRFAVARPPTSAGPRGRRPVGL